MKQHLLTIVILWITLVAEFSRPDIVPHGALLYPLTATFLVWSRGRVTNLLCGLILVIDWIARPSLIPIAPVVIPFVSTFLMSAYEKGDRYSARRNLIQRLPGWMFPVMITAIALCASYVPGLIWYPKNDSLLLANFFWSLATAVSVALTLTLGCRIADRLGYLSEPRSAFQ